MNEIEDPPAWPEPKTPAEFRDRAEQMMRQASDLPRVGFTLMAMSLWDGAAEMLAEANRLEEESGDRFQRVGSELREQWDAERREAEESRRETLRRLWPETEILWTGRSTYAAVNAPNPAGPNRKARRAAEAKARKAVAA